MRYALAAILLFVGAKLLLGEAVSIPTWTSLAFIAVAITAAVAMSAAQRPRASLHG